MKCAGCNRPLTDPVSIAEGIGPICKNKQNGFVRGNAYEPKVILISGPYNYERRTWLVIDHEKTQVRVFPLADGSKTATCYHENCLGTGVRCRHIEAVAKEDFKRFSELLQAQAA